MSDKPMSEKQCFESYKAYESHVEKEVKSGVLSNDKARTLLIKARKNYSNQSYNKILSRMK